MKESLKKLTKGSIFYTFANSIEALSPFILAVMLTRILEPHEYGIWVLFIALVTFLRPAINWNAKDAFQMHFYELDNTGRAHFIWSSFSLTLSCALVVTCLLLVFAAPVSWVLNFPHEWLVAIPLTAFLFAEFYLLLVYNQFSSNGRQYLQLQLIQTTSTLASIGVFMFFGWGWAGAILGKMVGLSIACIVGWHSLTIDLKILKVVGSRPNFKRLMRFGLLYMPTGLAAVTLAVTDKVIVASVLGLAENGLFGVATLFGAALFIFINGFLHAWMPWLFHKLTFTEEGSVLEVIKISIFFLLTLPILGTGFYLASLIAAPLVIGEAFSDAFAMIPWALAGTVTMGYFLHNQAFLLHRQSVLEMSISSTLCILLNAILTYIWAIYYGVTGVFVATIVSFLSAALLSLFFMSRTQAKNGDSGVPTGHADPETG